MSATSPNLLEENSLAVFQLKGSLFTLTVLQLITADTKAFSAQLEAMLIQAPKFFHNAPIVIDLHKLTVSDTSIDLAWYVDRLKQAGLVLIGLRNISAALQAEAIKMGLAVLPDVKTDANTITNKTTAGSKGTNVKSAAPLPQTSKIVTQQVRSGQQIYAKGGDLIVLAPVSPGAELLADGNIHVYAPLRGRALAGINGDTSARIFCQSLEAELVSIAGHYWIKDDIKSAKEQQPVQIYLENDKLKFNNIK